jgi:beta-glucosidase
VTDKDTPAGDLTYTATSGLPPGLTLGAGGVLTGTPLLQLSPGDFTVAFTVRDAGPAAVPGTFVLTVLRAAEPTWGYLSAPLRTPSR